MKIRKKKSAGLVCAMMIAAGVFLMFQGRGSCVSAYEGGFSFDYIVPDADIRYLSEDEISWMSLQTIAYAKNEIYARRGWIFSSYELSEYFGNQAWYVGRLLPSEFSEQILNEYELANAKLLQRRENELNPYGYQLDQPGYTFDAVYQDLYGTSCSVQLDFGYVIPGSDLAYLSESDLADLTPQELCYARNEIYARHGRLFQSGELNGYFSQKAWYYGYISGADFSGSVFNIYEQANIALLKDYEERVYGGYWLDQPGYDYSLVRSVEENGSSLTCGEESFIFADSSVRYLTDDEVAGLPAQWLCYARNEIYARHGRLFDRKELRDYFNSQTWYYGWIEPEEFSPSMLNEYEVANIALLKQYEYLYEPGGYELYS